MATLHVIGVTDVATLHASFADAVDGAEHHHVRGLPEPVVDVAAPPRTHPPQRRVLRAAARPGMNACMIKL